MPSTRIGGARSCSRNATTRSASPARNGTVLLTAMLPRNGPTQADSGSVGSRARSIHHQRTMRTAYAAARNATASSRYVVGRLPKELASPRRSTLRSSSQRNAAVTSRPAAGFGPAAGHGGHDQSAPPDCAGVSIDKAVALLHQIEWTLLDLAIDPPQVLADDAQEDQLHTAEKEDRDEQHDPAWHAETREQMLHDA